MTKNNSIPETAAFIALILLLAGITIFGLVYLFGVRDAAPVVDQLVPPNGTVVPQTNQTTVSVAYHDNKNIDTTRTSLVIDGNNVTPRTAISPTGLTWNGSLAPGTRRATVTIVDSAGNSTAQTWYFTITSAGSSIGTVTIPNNQIFLTATPLPTLTPIPGQLPLMTLTPIPGQISIPGAVPITTATP